jgi:hypothetical protein
LLKQTHLFFIGLLHCRLVIDLFVRVN